MLHRTLGRSHQLRSPAAHHNPAGTRIPPIAGGDAAGSPLAQPDFGAGAPAARGQPSPLHGSMSVTIATHRLLQRGCCLALRLGGPSAELLQLQRLLGRRTMAITAFSQPGGAGPAARARWAQAAAGAAAAAPRPLAAAHGPCSSPQRRQRRQFAVQAMQQQQQQRPWPDEQGAARLHSLRLAPPLRPSGPRLPPLRLRALSPAWQQPGDEQHSQQHPQQQQQRGLASQAPWWQFWRRSGSGSEDGEELRPPAPLPPQPSAAHDRELKTVNVAVAVNGVIFVAKMFTWLTTGSG